MRGGIEWGRILTIAGMSGSGKSVTLSQLRRFICKQENTVFLSFEWEMTFQDQICRDISAEKNISFDKVKGDKLDLDDEFKNREIYMTQGGKNVEEFERTVAEFVKEHRDKNIVITVDHIALHEEGRGEKEGIDSFYKSIIKLKNYLTEHKINCIFVVLSQLNREIGYGERVSDRTRHYPDRNDLYASSAIYNGSDYVLITHCPSVIKGMGNYYGGKVNGFNNGLPVYSKNGNALIYWHLIKNRFGKRDGIVCMEEDFEYSRIKEYRLVEHE